jgi:YVTN family beta-propeller protein
VWWVVAAPGAAEPPPSRVDIYAATAAGLLTGAARHARPLIYVPNSGSNTVTVIDQRTRRVVGHYRVGRLPQHVTPSWDLTRLWVSNDLGNSLQAFDPRTGRPRGRPVPVTDPYNLYFTPDGRSAIVVEEARRSLAFRDPHTWRLQHLVQLPCRGVDHMDFSADGRDLLASCEFSGDVVRVDLAGYVVHAPLHLGPGAMPQDVKLSPDGRVFYVAEMMRGGVYLIDASGQRVLGFIHTGDGAHGLYPSRDARDLYVTNRGAGTVSVLRFADRRVIATWRIPGGSPDMGGVSADGRTLWLSGRYNAEVYAIDTRSGRLRARIAVDQGPHGLAVWPQPGRHSLGHTGILR